MKNLEFVIDTREKELISRLDNDRIILEQLPVGDILFRQDGETVLVIERKAVADLKASICDGRGREQKARLLGSTPNHRIMYLIEGSLTQPKISGMPVSTLIGSLINTQLRDGIKVYRTMSLDESADFLCKLYDKLEKDGDNYFKEETQSINATQYSSTLKKQKKANMTPEVWFIAQLCLIPQVTEKVAEVITGKYPTIHNLIRTYENTPGHLRQKLLADLTFTLKTGKTRRIGDKMSERIYQFCYGIRTDEVLD
jgi:ERCC4-type nuclease